MVRFTGAESVGLAAVRALAHLAFWAFAIFRREAADMVRLG